MKKYGKLLIALTLAVSIFMNCTVVNALENDAYYTNQYGVDFTEDQYNFFTEFYWDGYQNHMTQAMLDEFSDMDFANAEVTKVGYCPVTRGTFFETEHRSIMIGKSCGALCRISTTVQWYVEPTTKSYDVIGAYLDGPTRISTPTTIIVGDDDSDFELTTKYEDDGFGAVVELPDAESINITQTFTYRGTGWIYASYQHAMTPITYANAQKFNIDFSGYGGVFDFYGGAVGFYDQFPGVEVQV